VWRLPSPWRASLAVLISRRTYHKNFLAAALSRRQQQRTDCLRWHWLINLPRPLRSQLSRR
jgi:hypothetical protein